jgi:hypothetical protein
VLSRLRENEGADLDEPRRAISRPMGGWASQLALIL